MARSMAGPPMRLLRTRKASSVALHQVRSRRPGRRQHAVLRLGVQYGGGDHTAVCLLKTAMDTAACVAQSGCQLALCPLSRAFSHPLSPWHIMASVLFWHAVPRICRSFSSGLTPACQPHSSQFAMQHGMSQPHLQGGCFCMCIACCIALWWGSSRSGSGFGRITKWQRRRTTAALAIAHTAEEADRVLLTSMYLAIGNSCKPCPPSWGSSPCGEPWSR